MTSPISLTAPAVEDINPHGATTGTILVPVTDHGTLALTISPKIENLTPTAKAHPAASWASIPSTTFTLQPGQTVQVPVHFSLPSASATGECQLVFDAKPVSHGAVQVSAGVATSLKVGDVQQVAFNATVARPHATTSATAAPSGNLVLGHHGTGSSFDVGLVALVAVLAVVAVAVWLRRKIRRGN